MPLASRDGWPLAERGLELWLYIMATAPRARARRLRSCPCCSALCPPRISNHEDIARWLDSGCVVKAFDETYRPVPLQRGSMVRRAVQTATGRGAEGSRRPHVRTVAPAPGLHSRLSCLGPAGAASDAGEAACSTSRWRVLTYQMNNVYNFDNLLIAKLPEMVRANSGGALDPHTVAASGCI